MSDYLEKRAQAEAEKKRKRSRRFKTVLNVSGKPNVNGIVYSREALAQAVDGVKKRLEKHGGRGFVCTSDPTDLKFRMSRASHLLLAAELEDRPDGEVALVAEIEILGGTEQGAVLADAIQHVEAAYGPEGVQFGITAHGALDSDEITVKSCDLINVPFLPPWESGEPRK